MNRPTYTALLLTLTMQRFSIFLFLVFSTSFLAAQRIDDWSRYELKPADSSGFSLQGYWQTTLYKAHRAWFIRNSSSGDSLLCTERIEGAQKVSEQVFCIGRDSGRVRLLGLEPIHTIARVFAIRHTVNSGNDIITLSPLDGMGPPIVLVRSTQTVYESFAPPPAPKIKTVINGDTINYIDH